MLSSEPVTGVPGPLTTMCVDFFLLPRQELPLSLPRNPAQDGFPSSLLSLALAAHF